MNLDGILRLAVVERGKQVLPQQRLGMLSPCVIQQHRCAQQHDPNALAAAALGRRSGSSIVALARILLGPRQARGELEPDGLACLGRPHAPVSGRVVEETETATGARGGGIPARPWLMGAAVLDLYPNEYGAQDHVDLDPGAGMNYS